MKWKAGTSQGFARAGGKQNPKAPTPKEKGKPRNNPPPLPTFGSIEAVEEIFDKYESASGSR